MANNLNSTDLSAKALLAMSKDRKAALSILVPRIRDLFEEAKASGQGLDMNDPLWLNGLKLYFFQCGWSVYFRVDESVTPTLLMSGHLDPNPPGKYLGGALHLMTWKRGWESRLFSPDTLPGPETVTD